MKVFMLTWIGDLISKRPQNEMILFCEAFSDEMKCNLSQRSKPSLQQCHLYMFRFQLKLNNRQGWENSKTLRKSETAMDLVDEETELTMHMVQENVEIIWTENGHGWGRPGVLLLFRLFSRREKCSLALPSSGWEKWNLFICICRCLTTNG